MEEPSQLPLSEATYFILLSLAAGPRHGYAIMKDVRQLSTGRVVLSTGTLYGALKRLLDQDWIRRSDSQPGDGGAARSRKAYALTAKGKAALDGEVARLESLLGAARIRTLGSAP